MNYVTRINLKTDCNNRDELVRFCLQNKKEQYVVIGWSYIYKTNQNIKEYKDFYYAVRSDVDRINHALNVFWDAEKDDLFWTRDLSGEYWICRAKNKAITLNKEEMDIGAAIPVEAFKVGMEVPGQIKASFNRPRGGIAEKIYDDIILEYSKYIYNKVSGGEYYNYNKINGELIDNLPDFDLEELVIAYLQIEKNYYVLSNSIANKSTTIKIECELYSRSKEAFEKAVVQVKGGKTKTLDALDYKAYSDEGFKIYLFAPNIINLDKVNSCECITKEDLLAFYYNYKSILPDSITKWEMLFE